MQASADTLSPGKQSAQSCAVGLHVWEGRTAQRTARHRRAPPLVSLAAGVLRRGPGLIAVSTAVMSERRQRSARAGRPIPQPGRSLPEKKKVFCYTVFPKKPAGTPCVKSWFLAVGGWWRLVVVGGSWWLVIGGWWQLVVVGGWRLVAAGGWRRLVVGGWWRLAVGGSWRLAVGGPLGRSLRAVLSKKKSGSLRTALPPTPVPDATPVSPSTTERPGSLPRPLESALPSPPPDPRREVCGVPVCAEATAVHQTESRARRRPWGTRGLVPAQTRDAAVARGWASGGTHSCCRCTGLFASSEPPSRGCRGRWCAVDCRHTDRPVPPCPGGPESG